MSRILILFLLFCPSANLLAQSTLNLPDAINIALKNSLDLQLAQNKISTDSINNNIGIAGGLPVVTGTINDNEQVSSINQKLNTGTTISRAAAASNALNANITGSILLYNGGRVIATKKRLAELEKQSRIQLTSQVQTIISDVMTAYFDIIRQQTYVKTIDRSIETANQKLEIVKVSQRAGLANNADLFQAQIDLNVLIQSKQAQQTVIGQAKTELLRLLTLNPDSSITVVDTILVDRGLLLEPILASLPKNADVLAADQLVLINTQVVKETEALRYPSIRATSGFNFARNQAAAGQTLLNQSYGPFVGVNVSIPIYNGGIYRRQKKTAEINVHNAEIQKSILLRDYSSQVVKFYQSYADALKQLDTEVQNYRLAGQLMDLSLKRFQLRQATIIEVRNAQQNFEQSGYRVVNLSFAAKAAEIGLKKLANQLTL
jgi:outer membrane protein TolC